MDSGMASEPAPADQSLPHSRQLPAVPQQFPVCPSVPQQFPVMVLEDCSTSQQLPASHSMSHAHHSSFKQVTACPTIVAICWKNT